MSLVHTKLPIGKETVPSRIENFLKTRMASREKRVEGLLTFANLLKTGASTDAKSWYMCFGYRTRRVFQKDHAWENGTAERARSPQKSRPKLSGSV